MSLTLFDGGRTVESRHCRDLAKILSTELDRWNEFRGALGIPMNQVKALQEEIKDSRISGEAAFYHVIYLWISQSRRNATFGALIDVLARQLEFLDAANRIMERQWV